MKSSEIHIRDPFVLVHGGKYYLYGSRGKSCWGHDDGFDVYVGDDLENWEGPFVCFRNDGTFWADYNYWAPEVHEWNGKFYMFASFKPENRRRGTAILCADSPMGPFRDHSRGCVTPEEWECLDGTFYVSRDGRPYMVFCHEWLQAVDGTICAMPLRDDLSGADGDVITLFNARSASWVKAARMDDGFEGYVTDGPFMYRTAEGALLMLWASFSGGGYTEGLAISDNGEIDGKFTQLDPLFEKDGGHGMVFRSLDGQLYMVLHSPNVPPQERPHFIKIAESGGRLIRA